MDDLLRGHHVHTQLMHRLGQARQVIQLHLFCAPRLVLSRLSDYDFAVEQSCALAFGGVWVQAQINVKGHVE